MTRHDLEQYRAVKLEIDYINGRIKKTENEIAKLLDVGVVKDRVYGGEGGIQGFNIEGYPSKLYEEKLRSLRTLQYKLCAKETALTDMASSVVDFLDNEVQESRDRMVFNLIYIEGKSQNVTAQILYMDQSTVSRIISRYLKDA